LLCRAQLLGRQAKNIPMISKYRNRALIYCVFAVTLTVIALSLGPKVSHLRVERSGIMIASTTIASIAAWVLWVLTGLSLVRAKGYSKDFTGSLFMMVIFFGMCCPFLIIGFPLVVLFGMEDKTRHKRRRH